MKRTLRNMMLAISLVFLLFFVLFVINQTAQIVQLAERAHPLLGTMVFWMLIAVYALLVFFSLYFYLRLPKALVPPEDKDTEEYNRYLVLLTNRLRRNSRLDKHPLETRMDIKKAIHVLDKQANAIIKKNAATVFLTTAISQSGRLDAFTVLIAQIRMVWQVATIYYQRPLLRELTHLYANVAATALVAGELNDIDVSRQVEPIITSVLGASLSGTIPGVNRIASIITNSLLTGSANAYLTLRIGSITKRYCGSLIRLERRAIRRSAALEAARMLSRIVMDSAGNITKAFVSAAVKSPARISRNVVRSTMDRLSGKKGDKDDEDENDDDVKSSG